MRGLVGKLLAVAASVALAGCAGEQVVREQWVGLVSPDVLAKADLQYYWHFKVDLQPGESLERVYHLDENLYCLTSNNRLLVLDALRGIPKWRFQVAKPGQTVFRPIHRDDMLLPEKVSGMAEILQPERVAKSEPFDAVLINSLSHVYVLNRTTGKLIRVVEFPFAANTGGATDGAHFVVGATSGLYHALRLMEAVPTWTKGTDDLLTAPVEHYGGRVFVGSEDRTFRSTRISDWGVTEWIRRTGGPITAPFVVDKRGCFVPCEDNRLYAFSALGGAELWRPFVCQGPLRDPVQVGKTSVFQYARQDKFYAVNLASGRKRWSTPVGRLVLMVTGGDVYLLDANLNLLVIDEILGQIKNSLPMTGFNLFVGNAMNPVIYAGTRDGRLVCIRPLGAGHLKPEMFSKSSD